MFNDTSIFDVNDIKSAEIKMALKEVIEALEKSGYQPMNQLVGYIISGDPGYITSRHDARSKITKLDRAEIVQEILKVYLDNK